MSAVRATAIILGVGACAICLPADIKPVVAQPKSNAEVRAQQAYGSCLFRSADSIDDLKSEPSTIARAALDLCQREFEKVVDAYTEGMSPEGKAGAHDRVMADPSYLDHAITIVLREREFRAKPR